MDQISLDNFSVYWENLSSYYITCILLSFFAVLLAWWYLEDDSKKKMEMPENEKTEEVDVLAMGEGLLTEMKVARQEAIDQELSAGMSEEQRQQEKETEKEQLAAIFDLLREQEEKFNVNSIEELQSQMKLYRR